MQRKNASNVVGMNDKQSGELYTATTSSSPSRTSTKSRMGGSRRNNFRSYLIVLVAGIIVLSSFEVGNHVGRMHNIYLNDALNGEESDDDHYTPTGVRSTNVGKDVNVNAGKDINTGVDDSPKATAEIEEPTTKINPDNSKETEIIEVPPEKIIPVEAYSTKSDLRRSVERPFMETTSRTFMDSVEQIEKKYKPSPLCSQFGGMDFLKNLSSSEKKLLKDQEKGDDSNKKSQIISYGTDKMDIFIADYVSVVVKHPNESSFNGPEARYTLEVNGSFDNGIKPSSLQSRGTGQTLLTYMTKDIQQRNDGIPECTEFIDYPVMLVDNDIDANNWWFFLVSALKHYTMMTVVQSHVMGDYQKDLKIVHTTHDANYRKPFFDAFDFMFADGRARDSEQMWLHQPLKKDVDESTNMILKRYCFRKLIWSPGGSAGGDTMLINESHQHSSCFSSIVYSYAAYIKAALHVPTLPRPEKPRVIWVGRDSSDAANPTAWQQQRVIYNQDQVISYLKEQCSNLGIDLIVADFYGDKRDTAFQEQALLASRANIMIGVHGAGLNMFHFLPFNSVVVEIHMGTSVQKNSANFVHHIHEGKYISVDAKIDRGSNSLDEKHIWGVLEGAINDWEKLGANQSNAGP
eukprot:CAMPEP_0194086774 /NCGR_PEP_ID=MMETSP0149-20130528/22397_1 /TAXON_ID=122233 /ORGANISM="Chaetoceros debilis, Strain MM31A-1" /LENGTH=630 /DNA_ID=CAMNT_0038769949 /DNA_START=24 /DNA_END=1916 /DNA_ORIENTATION=+